MFNIEALPYLTIPIVYSACPHLIGHSLRLYFSWHNCLSLSHPFVIKLFPDVEIFKVFGDNITSIKLRMPSGETPRYHVIIYFSRPNICIHSLEVAKISKPAPSDLFRDTNYTELSVEFLSSNMLFKTDTTDPVNHTIVSRCKMTYCFARCCPCFATSQQTLRNKS